MFFVQKQYLECLYSLTCIKNLIWFNESVHEVMILVESQSRSADFQHSELTDFTENSVLLKLNAVTLISIHLFKKHHCL